MATCLKKCFYIDLCCVRLRQVIV